MIYYNFEDVNWLDLNVERITEWINLVLQEHNGLLREVSYIFCSDSYILNINREYLNHDYYTDIITFDYCEENIIRGDIFISLDTVRSNAKEYGSTFAEELNRVIIHGILHLLGFKDETKDEAKIMRQMEDQALELLKTI